MQLLALSFLVFLIAMTGMAAGVIAGRSALRGSCGGINLPDGTRIGGCGNCTKRSKPCPRRQAEGMRADHGER